MSDQKIYVLIVDDHPVVVEGLRSLLGQLPSIEVAGSAANAFEAMALLKGHVVDIVLLDINLPDVSGIDLCKKIKKEFPAIKILGISTFADRSYISRMIANGAAGYLIKSATAEEIAEAIRTVLQGKIYLSLELDHIGRPSTALPAGGLPMLTKREKEVLQLISEGFTNGEIAAKLFISHLTVDSHRKNLLTKLGVANTAALIRLAVEQGLI